MDSKEPTTVERLFRNMDALGMRAEIEMRDGVRVLAINSKCEKHGEYAKEVLQRQDMVQTLAAWVRLRDMEVPCG